MSLPGTVDSKNLTVESYTCRGVWRASSGVFGRAPNQSQANHHRAIGPHHHGVRSVDLRALTRPIIGPGRPLKIEKSSAEQKGAACHREQRCTAFSLVEGVPAYCQSYGMFFHFLKQKIDSTHLPPLVHNPDFKNNYDG